MAVTADKPAPYTAPSAILDVIDRFRNRGLPTPINAEVLGRAGVSQGLIPRTLQALQSLELISEDGKPTATFDGIRLAPEGEYKKRLEDWLKAVYADVFAFVDPAKDSEIQIRDAFRSYQPIGQQSRMVTLFQGLCAAAGLMAEKAPTSRTPSVTRISNNRPLTARAQHKTVTAGGAGKRNTVTQTSSSIPAPLSGLLSGLPQEGNGWTKEKRQKFIDTFTAVLDFCFPVIEDDAGADDQEDAQE